MNSRFVYVAGDQNGALKIGISFNPTQRLTQLQHTSPLVLHHQTSVSGSARSVERVAHLLLSEKRLRGEWFDVSIEEAIAAVELAVEAVEAADLSLLDTGRKMDNIGVRLHPGEREALERAAAVEGRTMSALLRKIFVDWLETRGSMKAPRPPRRKSS